jgi:predicted lysophospholipase L1 biosynthesis ABC-type transport system permease subunit
LNFRVFFKSVKFAFRARIRVLAFILIYAILFIIVSKGMTNNPSEWLTYFGMAFIVATIYAILISQFRRRDISIFKCIGWDNNNVMLLMVGEVVLVSFSAFLLVFQVSIEIIGFIGYFGSSALLTSIRDLLFIDLSSMAVTLLVIIVCQIPGLLLSMYRATKIPPMRALREE